MPDLGPYAVPVLAAYAVSLLLIAIIVLSSWRSWIKVKRQLKEVEKNGES